MRFDWQADNDYVVGSDLTNAEPPSKNKSLSRWIGLVLFIILIFTGGVITVHRFLSFRIEKIEDQITEEIAASYKLVQLTALNADYELFLHVFSGRDPEWVFSQWDLLQSGNFLDRRGLGLTYIPSQAEPNVIDLEISADLYTTQAIFSESYAIDQGNGLTATIVLTQSVIFNRGADQWLFAPQDETSWGEEIELVGEYVTLRFPESEMKFSSRLFTFLEEKMGELCAFDQEAICFPDPHLLVRLSSDPGSLLLSTDLAEMTEHNLENGELILPAPRLVGYPVDEEGTKALLRGYAYQVVGSVFLNQIGYECCQKSSFMEALLHQLLADLSLLPNSLNDAAYDSLMSVPTKLSDPHTHWVMRLAHPRDESVREAAAVIAFIRHLSPETNYFQIGEAIKADASYGDFLENLIRGFDSDIALRLSWEEFLYQNSSYFEEPLPYPFPEQDILTLCGYDEETEKATLFRYRPTDQYWDVEISDRSFSQLIPCPGNCPLLLVGERNQLSKNHEPALFTFENEQVILHWQFPENSEFYDWFNIAGNEYIVYTEKASMDEGNVSLLNLSAGTDVEFNPLEINGIPIFAPDGEYMLVSSFEVNEDGQNMVYLVSRDRDVEKEIGPGRLPFWIDPTTFGIVLSNADGVPSLAMGSVEHNELQTITSLNDMIAVIPDERLISALGTVREITFGSPAFYIEAVTANPIQPDWLIVILRAENYRANQIMAVNVNTRQVRPLFEVKGTPTIFYQPWFSPNGNWLVVPSYNFTENRGQVQLYNSETETLETLPLHDVPFGLTWTTDERWFLKVDGDWLVLIAPETGYQHIFIHAQPTCGPAGFVDK